MRVSVFMSRAYVMKKNNRRGKMEENESDVAFLCGI